MKVDARARRRRTARRQAVADPDAIWRGDVDDADIIFTYDDDGDSARRESAERHRRNVLVRMFGEPIGMLAADDQSAVRRRGHGDGQRGTPLDQNRTAGCREEIQVSILAHPVTTAEIIADGDLLRSASKVRVRTADVHAGPKQLDWQVGVATSPWSTRSATLRLYGSPSSNVTVITLTPTKSRRRGARLFLRAGLRSMFELRAAIETELDHSGRTWPIGVALRT